jgi:acetyl esterase/lipase
MIHETIALWDKHPEATLTSYCITSTAELKLAPRRAVVVCPGGGYHFLSDREAEPIVFKFLAAGFNVFLLRYSVRPNAHSYAPLIEAGMAIKYVRENAEKYNTDPNYVFIGGFSAGGHLAASTGILWKEAAVQAALGASAENPTEIGKPNGMILSYPVITAGDFAHKGSFHRLCNTKTPTDEELVRFSLEKHVDETSAPFFLWHTFTDKTVPIQNALLLAQAYTEKKLPFEMHIYPEGVHGLALANEDTMSKNTALVVPHVQSWIELAVRWVKDFGHFGPAV